MWSLTFMLLLCQWLLRYGNKKLVNGSLCLRSVASIYLRAIVGYDRASPHQARNFIDKPHNIGSRHPNFECIVPLSGRRNIVFNTTNLPYIYNHIIRAPQSKRISSDLWNLIDFVGSFSNVHNDTKRLLEIIGAWEYGTGWGKSETEEIFGETKTKHATGSSTRYDEVFTESLEKEIEKRYHLDYKHEAISRALNLNER